MPVICITRAFRRASTLFFFFLLALRISTHTCFCRSARMLTAVRKACCSAGYSCCHSVLCLGSSPKQEALTQAEPFARFGAPVTFSLRSGHAAVLRYFVSMSCTALMFFFLSFETSHFTVNLKSVLQAVSHSIHTLITLAEPFACLCVRHA